MNHRPQRRPAYRPIEDYGIVGNTASVALVRLDGSIDWCCLPAMDSPSVFAALLDAEGGGYFQVCADGFESTSQHYLEATNILVTTFETPRGRLEVVDFMPAGAAIDRKVGNPCGSQLYRLLRCVEGRVEVDITWAPRHDYARADTFIGRRAGGVVALGGECPLALAGLDDPQIMDSADGPAVVDRLSLGAGEERLLATVWNQEEPQLPDQGAGELLAQSAQAWRSWLHHEETGLERPWAGERADMVLRSELVLKLMTQPGSGALAAAPTTSLPETIGGPRNWDYRFTWIRDAAQIAQAFFALDHHEEADAFLRWAEEVACQSGSKRPEGLQILYALRSETELKERTLDHLEGYRQSSPVRIGNDAAAQLQLDVYGEVLNAVYERVHRSESFEADYGDFLSHVAEEATQAWHHPDFSIWEMQNGPFHFVYSKVMTWVALHRACWLSKKGFLEGNRDHWREVKEQLKEQIFEHGFDDEIGSFVQRLGDYQGRLDAANLLLPLMEFLPAEDPRVQGTIDRSLERLTVNDLVYRYRGPDGLAGEEGAFVLCTFWLVDALTLSDRLEEAQRIYDGLMDRANHLGLFAEQIDPFSGEFLGNFPQSYSHLGAINSTLYLAAKKGREIPVSSLMGRGGSEEE